MDNEHDDDLYDDRDDRDQYDEMIDWLGADGFAL
jgi:hypothetical protein